MNKHEYFEAPGISQSALADFEISPEYYKFRIEERKKPTLEMGLGSALHYLVFEPDHFDDYMVVMKRPEKFRDYRTKEAQEWRDAFIRNAEEAGVEIIEQGELDKAKRMRDKLYSVTESKELLEYTRNEFEKASQWEWDGILFKRKVDVTSDLFLLDLKSTRDASPGAFSRTIYEQRYYRQMGMYSDGEKILGDSILHKESYIIAIENAAPYGVSVHRITDDYLERGVIEYRNLAKKLVKCIEEDKWPTYTSMVPGGIQVVDVPNWLKNE